jgi:hypothetical protein
LVALWNSVPDQLLVHQEKKKLTRKRGAAPTKFYSHDAPKQWPCDGDPSPVSAVNRRGAQDNVVLSAVIGSFDLIG